MSTLKLVTHLRHQGEVNRLLTEAGFTEGPMLSEEELRLHTLAVEAGVTPQQFVADLLTDRRHIEVAV